MQIKDAVPLATEFSLAEKQQVVDRFTRLVSFLLNSGETGATYKRVSTAFNPYADCYSRFIGLHRLPNLLIYGSDTQGKELTEEFLQLVTPVEARPEIRSHSNFFHESHKASGRHFNAGEIDYIDPSMTFHASPPHTIDNAINFMNRGRGGVMIFFEPNAMANHHVGAQLFRVPPFSTVEKIFVAWPEQFGLERGER
ncbi:hypothetical protein KC921_03540 [Candidatus Woesebacteria bacterium]|nr:hypothetical protein [Candidatus Woesebacteria bacterium]